MGQPGRKPIPTHLAIVDKAHAYRHNNQPEPSKIPPVPPEHLTDEEKIIFNQLVERISELYPPSETHTEMLTLYAETRALANHLDYKLKYTYGSTTYRTEDKQLNELWKPYPEVQQLQTARKQCADILREFGLSPSSQRNVKIEKPKGKANPFASMGKAENQ